jgi:hypothetical protein
MRSLNKKIFKLFPLFLILIYARNAAAFTKPQGAVDPSVASTIAVSPQPSEIPVPQTIDTTVTREHALTTQSLEIKAIESITVQFSEDIYTTPEPSKNKDEEFLADLVAFTKNHCIVEDEIQEEDAEVPATFLYIIPRPYFIKDKVSDFKEWYEKKDTNYTKNKEIRSEWETLLGIDIFRPYYKYKEARKALKKKVSFDTSSIIPGLPKMDVTPEYKDKKLYLIFSKKF